MTGVDVPPVEDGAQALVLMVHHLGLAAAYFEATDIDKRTVAYINASMHEMAAKAALAWLDTLEAHYNALDNAVHANEEPYGD